MVAIQLQEVSGFSKTIHGSLVLACSEVISTAGEKNTHDSTEGGKHREFFIFEFKKGEVISLTPQISN